VAYPDVVATSSVVLGFFAPSDATDGSEVSCPRTGASWIGRGRRGWGGYRRGRRYRRGRIGRLACGHGNRGNDGLRQNYRNRRKLLCEIVSAKAVRINLHATDVAGVHYHAFEIRGKGQRDNRIFSINGLAHDVKMKRSWGRGAGGQNCRQFATAILAIADLKRDITNSCSLGNGGNGEFGYPVSFRAENSELVVRANSYSKTVFTKG